MIQSILYKEWLKIRWFLIGITAVGILALAYIYLNMQYDISAFHGHNYWNNIIFRGVKYYAIMKYIPACAGIVLAISQFVPEITDKRIKLTFHLPQSENKSLLQMIGFGSALLIISFAIQWLMFIAISKAALPHEVVVAASKTIIPWFIAGFSAYQFTVLTVLEPVWKHRIIDIFVGGFFTSFFLLHATASAYGPSLTIICVVTILLIALPMYSGYRFRKGVQQ